MPVIFYLAKVQNANKNLSNSSNINDKKIKMYYVVDKFGGMLVVLNTNVYI